MSRRASGRAPHHLTAVFVALTLVPSVLLAAVGWRLFANDRNDRAVRRDAAVRRTAETVETALEQAVGDLERLLAESPRRAGASSSHDAVVAVFADRSVAAFPAGLVAFLPVQPSLPEADDATFAAGEGWIGRRDFDAAADWFNGRSQSSNVAVQAGALVRLARIQAQEGRVDAAIATYRRIVDLDSAAVAGIPASLFARWAICRLLAVHDKDGRRDAARALREELRSGRWQLTREQYEANLADLNGWLDEEASPNPTDPELLAEAIATVARYRDADNRLSLPGPRKVLMVRERAVTVLSREMATGGLVTFIALPTFVEREWIAKARAVSGAAAVTIVDPTLDRHLPTGAARLSASDTGLPWSLVVDAGPEAIETGWSSAQTLWLTGFAALGTVIVTGAYVVTRAAGRELAVARLQSEFVAAVSHEFRTPLTSMRQITEGLIDDRLTSEERRVDHYRTLHRQTGRLHRLVESLLDLGRIEAGITPYRMNQIETCDLVREAAARFEQEHGSDRVHIDLPTDPVPIQADRDAFATAIWNLLDNAHKYSPDGSPVDVRLRRQDDLAMIEVCDRGYGIPQDEQREIFAKFVRGRRARNENIRGTGIGLALAQLIVRAHGGTIEVASRVGQGSTFTIAVPLCRRSSDAGTTAPGMSELDQAGTT